MFNIICLRYETTIVWGHVCFTGAHPNERLIFFRCVVWILSPLHHPWHKYEHFWPYFFVVVLLLHKIYICEAGNYGQFLEAIFIIKARQGRLCDIVLLPFRTIRTFFALDFYKWSGNFWSNEKGAASLAEFFFLSINWIHKWKSL